MNPSDSRPNRDVPDHLNDKSTIPDALSTDELAALHAIVEGTACHTGQEFFHSLVRHLAAAIGTRYAFVAVFTGGTRARTVAFWLRDRITDNIEWDVTGTPCEDVAVIVVVILAAVLGPKGPTGPPDPTLPGANPRPEWPFLWLFALLSLSPPAAETFIILVFPLILIGILFLVPFVSNRGERAPSRRPVAVLAVIVIYTALGVLTYQGATSPWSPQMTAWSGDPVPENLVRNSSPLRLQGALVFQNKNCRNCHALEGRGGRRGPDLTTVGTRLTYDQLVDQVSNGTPGGGNMPAYGKQINAAEMTALAEFLANLRPQDAPAAKPASVRTEEKEYP